MLCESVTRNVVNRPNSTCCATGVFINPMAVVTIKLTIETNEAVSNAKTISRILSCQFREKRRYAARVVLVSRTVTLAQFILLRVDDERQNQGVQSEKHPVRHVSRHRCCGQDQQPV